MNISDVLRAKIDRFEADFGRKPSMIRMGRSQVRALLAFRNHYTGSQVTEDDKIDGPNFDGIKIEEVDHEDFLEVVNS